MSRSRYEAQIRKILAERPTEAAIDFDGVPFTWGDAQAIASTVERTLEEAVLADGEKIGLMGRNRPAHFAALWGVFLGARCASMVHAFQPPAALAADLTANRWPMVFGEARDWTPEVVAAAESAGTVGYALTGDPANALMRVTKTAKPGPQANRVPERDVVVQLLSSGTTGKPKRISLSRTAIDELIERTIQHFEMGGPAERGTQIMSWPISSLGGTNAALPCAVLGQCMAIQEKFNAPRLLEMIRRYRPTFLGIPPSAMGMLLQLEPSREDLSSIKFLSSGSAPLDPNVHRRLVEDYGLPVANVYGATEFAGIISNWRPEDMKLLGVKGGSAGRAMPGMQIRIVAPETGDPLPPGKVGLIEALVPRVGPDWVRTNDLGYMDEDGFLYLEGRADDVIMRGGFKIVPEEVAEVLRLHPKVRDAALIGIADDRVGTVPAAAIEKRVNAPAPTAQELEEFLRTRLPAYKIPVRFAIVDEIPRTQSMKPRREGLRELFI